MKKYIWTLALCSALWACQKNEVLVGPDAPGNTDDVTLPAGDVKAVGQPIAGTEVQREIGPSGGELVSGDGKFKLVFPAGALKTSQVIQIQQIQNTAPLGVAGLAYRLKPAQPVQSSQPVEVIYTYGEEGVPGASPELVRMAFQESNGVFVKEKGTPLVNATAKRVSLRFTDISDKDIALFSTYKLLVDGRDNDSLAFVSVLAKQQTNYKVEKIRQGTQDDRAVPLMQESLPPSDVIANILINGEMRTDVVNPYGYISSYQPNAFTYTAPARSLSSLIAISVEVKDALLNGQFLLVSNVKVSNVNTMKIYGKDVRNMSGAAVLGSNHFTVILVGNEEEKERFTITVTDIFAGAGSYSFQQNKPVQVNITASAGKESDMAWQSPIRDVDARPDYVRYGTGTIKITEYNGKGKFVKGTVGGSLWRFIEPKNFESTSFSGEFAVPVF